MLALALAGCTTRPSAPPPLTRAHAHNDYLHPRPLHDAIERGFCSIEADIHLVDGTLLVAHDRKDVKPGRTLTALYLDPLRERVNANGGRVHRGGPPITLLVDIKTEAVATYAALHEVLQRYASILTAYRGDRVDERAITVIVSGNRPVAEIAAQPVRYAAVDGRAADLDANPPARLVPWISDNWQRHFAWRFEGEMPAADRAALRRWVERAHAQGRKLRFWNTPDRPGAWQVLLEAGVDLIGTDDLDGLARFLRHEPTAVRAFSREMAPFVTRESSAQRADGIQPRVQPWVPGEENIRRPVGAQDVCRSCGPSDRCIHQFAFPGSCFARPWAWFLRPDGAPAALES